MKHSVVLTTSLTMALILSTGSSLARQRTIAPAAHTAATRVQIDTIEMANTSSGWALGHPLNAPGTTDLVLHTTDGGKHWVNVTPRAIVGTKYTLSQGHVTSDTIVIVQAIPDQSIRSYRTIDGGHTWAAGQPASAHYGDGILLAQFVDTTHGFAEDSSAGNGTLPGDLFVTNNGGATWTRVATTNWMSKTAEHNLPFTGEIMFTDWKNGWLTGGERAAQPGNIGGPGFVWLYRTTDGGIVWKHQSLSVPSTYRAAITYVSSPALVGSTGFVPVTYEIPGKMDEETVLYKTTDSGQTWSMVASPRGIVNSVGLLTANQGYLTMASGKLYWTSDGGRSWSAAAPTDGAMHYAIDGFVNRAVGWATAWAHGHSMLIETTNGGRSWSTVNATLLEGSAQLIR